MVDPAASEIRDPHFEECLLCFYGVTTFDSLFHSPSFYGLHQIFSVPPTSRNIDCNYSVNGIKQPPSFAIMIKMSLQMSALAAA